jgi:hypothetical protein
MHLRHKQSSSSQQIRNALTGGIARLAVLIGLAVLVSSQALAQYGGPTGTTGAPGSPTYTAPKGGYGSSGAAIGAGVGAAAGGGALFLVLHNRGAVTGCVAPTSDGLRLVDEKKNKTYALAPDSIALQPGELVRVKGKKSTDHDGTSSFQATKVLKSMGSCKIDSNMSSANPSQSSPK